MWMDGLLLILLLHYYETLKKEKRFKRIFQLQQHYCYYSSLITTIQFDLICFKSLKNLKTSNQKLRII